MYFAEEVKIERGHPIVICHAGEEVHKDKLTVALAPVSRLLVYSSLSLSSTFHDNDRWRATTSNS